jgi:hypothetical protein
MTINVEVRPNFRRNSSNVEPRAQPHLGDGLLQLRLGHAGVLNQGEFDQLQRRVAEIAMPCECVQAALTSGCA